VSNYNSELERAICQVLSGRGGSEPLAMASNSLEIDSRASKSGVLPGVDELASSGHAWAIGSESSPTPDSIPGLPIYGAGSSSFQESQGGVVVGLPEPSAIRDHDLIHTCAAESWVVVGECTKEGKHFARRIYCGKEWCPVCGQKRSRVHNRRIARTLSTHDKNGKVHYRALSIDKMGYFVIEFPDRYRNVVTFAYSKRALQVASDKIVEVMAGKRMGRRGRVGGYFSRGLLRWHWFGDKIKGKWNPHANLLVDGAYLEDLEPIKAALRSALHCPDLIVHYSFAELPAQKFQRVEYITRATFLKYEWSPYMASQLYGFRNSRWWGRWDGEAVWQADAEQESELLAADALESGLCPDCGSEMTWSKPVNARWLDVWQAVEIGETGYFRLPEKQIDGDVFSPADLMRLERMAQSVVSENLMRVRDKEKPWVEVLEYLDGNDLLDDM